jgi:hypothetical protein
VRLTSDEPRCPKCQRVIDAATSIEGEYEPRVGDVSVCAYCSALLEFVEPLPRCRLLSDAELCELDQDTRDGLLRALAISRALQASRRSETGP